MKTFSKFLVPLLAAGMFAACSDDKFDGPAGNDGTEQIRKQYLTISIAGENDFSRADADYSDGEEQESAIKRIYFAFYDVNGNLVSTVGPKGTEDFIPTTVDSDLTNPSDPASNITKLLTGTVEIEVEKGKADPAFVMCYVNPIQIGSSAGADGNTDELAQKTIGDVKNVKREAISTVIDGKDYFGMSNSVYYDDAHNIVRATAIPEGALKKDPKELATAKEVVIHVERYAAKVKVDMQENAVKENNLNGSDYTLTFVPEKWYLNARENKFFVSKSYTATETGDGLGAMGNTNKDFTSLNNDLFTGWNAPELHRSFWARSCAYFTKNVPSVSDDYKGHENEFALKYYSYDDLTKTDGGIGLGFPGSMYALENTIGKNAIDEAANTYAALSSVIMVGHYQLKKGTESYGETTPTFYVKDNKIYFDKEIKTGDATIIKGLLASNLILRRKVTVGTGTEAKTEYQEITEPTEAEQAYLKVYHPFGKTENAVSIHIDTKGKTDDQIAAANFWYRSSGVDKQIKTVADAEEANTLLLANIGTMDAYTNGKAFFSIPIHHLGWQRADNENKEATSIDFSKVKEGDFGIVRNHSYSLNISEVAGLGTGIFKPEMPLVPETSKVTYHAKYQIRVLSWRIVPVQNVKL